MAENSRREEEEVHFTMLTNDRLTCKDCIFNNQTNNFAVLVCAYYAPKPEKVLDGGECDVKKTRKDFE